MATLQQQFNGEHFQFFQIRFADSSDICNFELEALRAHGCCTGYFSITRTTTACTQSKQVVGKHMTMTTKATSRLQWYHPPIAQRPTMTCSRNLPLFAAFLRASEAVNSRPIMPAALVLWIHSSCQPTRPVVHTNWTLQTVRHHGKNG